MTDPLPIKASALGSRAALVGAIGIALARLHDGLFGSGEPSRGLAVPDLRRRA